MGSDHNTLPPVFVYILPWDHSSTLLEFPCSLTPHLLILLLYTISMILVQCPKHTCYWILVVLLRQHSQQWNTPMVHFQCCCIPGTKCQMLVEKVMNTGKYKFIMTNLDCTSSIPKILLHLSSYYNFLLFKCLTFPLFSVKLSWFLEKTQKISALNFLPLNIFPPTRPFPLYILQIPSFSQKTYTTVYFILFIITSIMIIRDTFYKLIRLKYMSSLNIFT